MNISEELLTFREGATENAVEKDVQGAIFICLLSLMGIVGNSILIDVYIHNKKRVLSTYFIIILGFIDLAICSICMPLRVILLFLPVQQGICGLYLSSAYLSVSCSIYLFYLIAIDRYQSVCRLSQPLFTKKHLKGIFIYMGFSNVSMGVISPVYLRGQVDIVDGNRTVTLLMREDFLCYVNTMLNHPQRQWDSRYIMHLSLAVLFTSFMFIVSGMYIHIFKTLKKVDAFRARSLRTVLPWRPDVPVPRFTKLEARPCYNHNVRATSPGNFKDPSQMNEPEKIQKGTDSSKYSSHETGDSPASRSGSSGALSKGDNMKSTYKQIIATSSSTLEATDNQFIPKEIRESKSPNEAMRSGESHLINCALTITTSLFGTSKGSQISDHLRRASSSRECTDESASGDIATKTFKDIANTQNNNSTKVINSPTKELHFNRQQHEENMETSNSEKEKSHFKKAPVGVKTKRTKRILRRKKGSRPKRRDVENNMSVSECSFHTDTEVIDDSSLNDGEYKTRVENLQGHCEAGKIRMEVWATKRSSVIPVAKTTIKSISDFPFISGCHSINLPDPDTRNDTAGRANRSAKAKRIIFGCDNRPVGKDDKEKENVECGKRENDEFGHSVLTVVELKQDELKSYPKALTKCRSGEIKHENESRQENKTRNLRLNAPACENGVQHKEYNNLDHPPNGGGNKRRLGETVSNVPVDRSASQRSSRPSSGAMSVKILRRLFLVTFFYYLCWVPFYLIELGFVPYNNILIQTFFVANMVNPLIHLTTSRPFRNEFVFRLKRLASKIRK